MKKIALSLLAVCLSTLAFSNTLYIKIQLGDCFKCFTTLKYIEKIDKNISVKYLLLPADEKVFEKINAEYFGGALKKQDVLFSAEKYNQYKGIGTSFFLVNNNDSLLIHNSLLKLPYFVPLINSFSGKEKASLKLVKKINLEKLPISSNIEFKAVQDKFIIWDKSFDDIYTIDKEGNVVNNVSAKTIDRQKLYAFDHNGDTAGFDAENLILKSYTSFYKLLTYSAIELENDTLFAILKTPSLIKVPTDDTGDTVYTVYFKYYMYKYYGGEVASFQKLNEKNPNGFPNFEKEFYIYKGHYFFPYIKSNNPSKLPLFSEYETQGNYISYIGQPDMYLPDFYIENKLNYNITSKSFSEDYIWFWNYPIIYNKHTYNSVILDTLIDPNGFKDFFTYSPGSLVDVVDEEEYFKIIFYQDKTYYMGFFSENGKELNRVKIDIDNSKLNSPLTFHGTHSHLVGFTVNGKINIYTIDI